MIEHKWKMKLLVIFVVILVLLSTFVWVLASGYGSYVKISEGELSGTVYTLPNGRELQAFFDIPYAAPPIGDERFQEPKPPQPWKGVRKASSMGNRCLQPSALDLYIENRNRNHFETIGEEDCLYLNVFTPKLPNDPNNEENLMNVLVYIHGGGFTFGSANDVYPEYILQDDDIVFVAINYRLGALGFFSMGHPAAPGNNGLKDQAEALRWVQRNIRYFGGNPAKVTIYGHSAGAASVHFQMISPRTRGLFQSAISSSGSVSLPWSLPDGVVEESIEFASSLNCRHKDVYALMECLKSKPINEIMEKAFGNYMKQGYLIDFAYAPVIEPPHPTAFLSENPYTLINASKIKHIPWMISVAENEGAIFAFDITGNKTKTNQINNQWNEIIPILFKYKNIPSEYERDYISASIRKYYMGNNALSNQTAKHFFQAFGDRHFYHGMIDIAKLYSAASLGNTYCSKFYYRGTETFLDTFSTAENNYGSLHSEDMMYVLKSFGKKTKSKNDLNMAKLLSSSIISFMKTGNPNIPELRVEWDPLSGNGVVNCLGIYSNTWQRMEDIEDYNTTRFWNNLISPEKYRNCDLNKS